MKAFKISDIVLDEIRDFEDLPKINKSDCDDILSQIIFQKIDQYAFRMCVSLHNAIFDKRDVLPFLILCLEDEISNRDLLNVTLEDTVSALDNTTKIFTPPNFEFKQVVTMKTYPKKANVNGAFMKVHFNPYMIALCISDIYFRLYHDKRIKDWCNKGSIKFESIEKILQIIDDKYSYRFVDLAEISRQPLTGILKLKSEEGIAMYEEFLGTKGTKLINYYITWALNFYDDDLLETIKGLFGKLRYS